MALSREINAEERAVVELIAAGLTRWAIADRLNLGESSVRETIRKLCAYFDCPMRDLPGVLGVAPPSDDGFSFLPPEAT